MRCISKERLNAEPMTAEEAEAKGYCIKQLQQKLRKEINGSLEIEKQLPGFGVVMVNIRALYHKQNKNGTYRKGLSTISLVPRYCPFCGKSYFEEDKR